MGAELDDPLGADVLSRLVSMRPELTEVIERLSRFGQEAIEGEEAPTLAMERDAVTTVSEMNGHRLYNPAGMTGIPPAPQWRQHD